MASILITGTSSGIGRETALAFGRAGYRVAATMRNPNAASELVEAALHEGLSLDVFQMDVDSDDSVREAMAQIGHSIGSIDVLVNNAGIEGMGPVEEFPLSAFRAVMETNYFGVIRCTQALLPDMRRRRSGCIINVASVAGHVAIAPMAPYASSKFALEAFSECLAQEVHDFNIRVAIVEPGIVDTRMTRHTDAGSTASPYPHQRRIAALFHAALQSPVPASLVAEKILEIAQSDTSQLRHPVGPDAVPFFEWRRSMSDEAWVALAALDDEAWYDRIEADFAMDVRPQAPERDL
jgi:NAD(P)-dependent dehydrogenase (short-subunit alcohol dehydrogenase family)